MEYFTEQAPTHAECIRKIKEKYGDNAKILMRKTVRIGGFLGLFTRDGVEMTGIVSNEPLRYATDPLKNVRKPLDLEEEKRKILAVANPKMDPTLQTVLQEVRSLKEKLESTQIQSKPADEHPNLLKISELLYSNDFSHNYTLSIQNRIKRDFSLEALEDFDALQSQVVEWIGESINVYQEPNSNTKPRVLILVGPTGVGKTTTIAKLAALYGVVGMNGLNPLSVRMITIDNYRIAAKQQIETYGNIMQIPVSCVETYEDLRKTIAMYAQEVDLVLVDTIGKSPRDAVKLAEMKEILNACGSTAEVHLAMAASTKFSDIKEIMQQYEPFNYRSIIVTKLDETTRVGNMISALAERGKTVSFITNGQKVPQDIERATAVRFLINLEGFRINRQKIEEKFAYATRDVL
ncbi:flagellar biosynthesis protein FlhF [Gracilinema caldarium]|uniref:Flagellar biosynthesis protein FlhF n=1 Tax=Gracilinema caldarium (strain ATCC 51460 / DSM 7334 / H1) TaxID=744872 RepID=F8EZ76_GRAC1|nr:flagellar biosynthesis protein FlhF [Gracilinema caldarium]AEJ19668.1 flagellar biosynthetic protein FlhF [Gracilinema caldarium DSM 7334]